jgi:two-component system, chemotaxis family, CheB/CheR fusion protein
MAADREALERILVRIKEARNFDFRQYKRATLLRRIERRMAERRCATLAEYEALLDASPHEYDALVTSLLIKVTSFFRDGEVWEALREKVVPALVESKRRHPEIRAWSVGCATGEEAYSIAMLACEALGPALAGATVKVFGTDVDETALATARRGVYPATSLAGMPPARRDLFFTPAAGGWSVRAELRRMVVFGVNNLVRDAPISRLDLLMCRNVFIYLDAQLQARVLTRFHYALRPNAFLVLGKSELIPVAAKLFEPLDLSRRVYRKTASRVRELPPMLDRSPPTSAEPTRREDELSAVAQRQLEVMNALPDPVIATTVDGMVTVWNAAAARIWKRTEDEVRGKRLAALGLHGVPGEMLLDKAGQVRDGEAERYTADVDVDDLGHLTFSLDVAPLRGLDGAVEGLVYVARDVSATRVLEAELRRMREQRDKAIEDLQTTAEEMQSANEELETTNEELQSANEELQTTNEELQSTNEELETTNEELQSTNAELDATNRELAHRTDELNVVSFQQRIIIRSISSAVVVVAPEGRILLWNLAAERLLGLTEAEAVGQVLWTLRIAIVAKALMKQLRKNVEGRLPQRVDDISYERPGGAVGHVALALVPLVDDGRGIGAVLLLEDTTRAVLAAEERLREELGTPAAPRRRAKKRRPAAAARRPAAAPRDRSRDET